MSEKLTEKDITAWQLWRRRFLHNWGYCNKHKLGYKCYGRDNFSECK
jgi:hypothetical protein